jgi:hypothetical protein
LRWTCKSTAQLAGVLTAAGHPVSDDSVGRLLKQQGYTLQRTHKTEEGAQHPDRDGQFRYVNEQARSHLAAGQPVVSVDTKKKEPVGNFANGGAEWQPAGEPEQVGVHDFPDPEIGKAIPYGVYDLGANAGWVSVGTDHDTAAFAVATLRRWWEQIGRAAYPAASRLLLCADAGGPTGIGSGRGDRTGPVRGRHGPCGHGMPLPARHLQVEQDRAPAVQPHLDQLAGSAAGVPPGDRGADRGNHDALGPQGSRCAGQRRLPAGRQGLRPGVGGGAAQVARLAREWNSPCCLPPHRPTWSHPGRAGICLGAPAVTGVRLKGAAWPAGGCLVEPPREAHRRWVAVRGLALFSGPGGAARRSGSRRGTARIAMRTSRAG